jgi:hypothetical protein
MRQPDRGRGEESLPSPLRLLTSRCFLALSVALQQRLDILCH